MSQLLNIQEIYILHRGSGNETSDACTGTNGTQVGTATATTPTTSCVSTGGPFSWFICMSLHTLGAVEDSIIGIVQSLLKTNPVDFSEPAYCSDPTSGQYASCTSNQKISATIYSVWSQFRIYGDTLLVIAVLVAIIIEAAGGGSIAEAYTVKRMLPRILVAAILINLSIYIIAGAEDIINVLGGGIQNLMLAPFNGISGAPSGAPPVNGVASTIHVSGSAGVLATLGLGGIAVVAGFTEGIAGIALFVLGSFVLAALGVLITIMIRQGLLVILLLTSPIAFALYCLPNTEQYFRKWWDLFIKTLVVYPIVMIVIAASSIAALIFSNFGLASPLNTLIAIFAAGAPLFLIPFAFKLSGGAIGQVHGAISGITDRGKQATNNMRQNNRKDRGERARNGQLFRGNSRLAKFNSGLAQGAMLAPKAGLNPTRWRAKMHEARGGQSFTQAQELMQNNHEFAGMAQDDTMLQATRALAAGDGAEARRILRADGLGRFNTQRELENGIAQAESVQRAGGSRAVQVATTMALAGINTGFEGRTDSHGNAIDTSKAMMAEIAEASGGDAVLANQMMGRMKGMATQAGRLEEGGASFGAMSGELRHALGARAAGGTYDQIAGAVDSHALNLDALVNNDSVTVVRSQTNSVSSLMGSAQQRLNELDTRQRSGAVLTVDEQAERGRLVSIVENTHTTGSMYAAPSRVTQTQQALDNTTRARSQIRLEVPVAPVRVPNPAPPTPPIASAAPVAPGAPAHPPAGPAAGPPAPPPPLYEMREIGENVDIHTGGLVPPGSAESQVPPQVRGLNEQRQRRAYNPMILMPRTLNAGSI
ncbi:MAG: hypothetical protein WDN66_00560 [Candidatus Saccharibacteria bacterium]